MGRNAMSLESRWHYKFSSLPFCSGLASSFPGRVLFGLGVLNGPVFKMIKHVVLSSAKTSLGEGQAQGKALASEETHAGGRIGGVGTSERLCFEDPWNQLVSPN